MTEKEAISILRKWRNIGEKDMTSERLGYIEGWFHKDDSEAFAMAIKSLDERKKFPKFKVIDNKTDREPDLGGIALNEEWANRLIYCDMQGFAITDEGDLLMIDECGQYEECPEGRFTVVMEGAEE